MSPDPSTVQGDKQIKKYLQCGKSTEEQTNIGLRKRIMVMGLRLRKEGGCD